MKQFIVTESLVMEIQNLAMNPKSRPVMSNPKQHQFLFKQVSSKYQCQNFSN